MVVYKEMEDEVLARAVQKKDTEAFGELLERYETKIYRYLRTLTNWDDMALQDMTQDTFIKCYQNILGYDAKRKFSSWLYAIAHNVGVDFLKKQKRKVIPVDELEEVLLTKQDFMEEYAIKAEQKDQLQAALEKLAIRDKDIIVLYYYEEKSYEEISDILRIPVNAVGVQLHRAKKRLQLFVKRE